LIRSAALIALTSQLVRLRKLAETCDIALADYPNVPAWMQRIEAREGYKAAG
jgi:glutathione S-transferase